MRPKPVRGSPFRQLHPIWRGIGLLLMILIPFIAYGFTVELINYSVDTNPELPQTSTQIIVGVDDLYLYIGGTILISVLLYLILTLIGSAVYSLSGAREREEIATRIGTGRPK